MPKMPALAFKASIALALSLSVIGPATAHDAGTFTLDFRDAPRGTMPWGMLAKVGLRREDGNSVPRFLPPLTAMAGKPVVLYGYMTARPGGGPQKRFLLSPRPIFCGECAPVGPEEIVEIVLERPTPATDRPLAVRGKLALLQSAPDGLLYRLESATVATTPHEPRLRKRRRPPRRDSEVARRRTGG